MHYRACKHKQHLDHLSIRTTELCSFPYKVPLNLSVVITHPQFDFIKKHSTEIENCSLMKFVDNTVTPPVFVSGLSQTSAAYSLMCVWTQ